MPRHLVDREEEDGDDHSIAPPSEAAPCEHTVRRGTQDDGRSVRALLTCSAVVYSATAGTAWGFDNQQIADKARSYGIGSHGGQCKVFGENVVNAVLAANGLSARVGGYGSPGGAY